MIEGHGDDLYRKYARTITANFSSNIYNGARHEGLTEHLCKALRRQAGQEGGQDLLSAYPEPEPYTLEQRLAGIHRLQGRECVCVTNGATEAIYLIAQALSGRRTRVLQPTFSEYADACRIHGHRLSSLYQLPAEREGFRFAPEVQCVWLCNPNNPTGTVVPRRQLENLIRENPDICFVIDQSYEAFTQCPVLDAAEAAAWPNVFLLHSMTKRYAIPGLRLGYVTGNGQLLQQLRRLRMPWSVNALAIEAGLYLTEHADALQADLPRCLAEARRLRQQLQSLGVMDVWESDTHFMLIRLRYGQASELKAYLANRHGLLIRDASNFEGLDKRYFRIASQTPAENDLLIKAIGQWLAEEA